MGGAVVLTSFSMAIFAVVTPLLATSLTSKALSLKSISEMPPMSPVLVSFM